MSKATGKNNGSKLHHFVPQGYLRGFATAHERITSIPLDRSRNSFTTSVRNVAAQNHFHTAEELEEPDWFEKALSRVEGEAIKTIRSFEKGQFPPSEEDRWAFSYYMALQSARGPDTRKTIEHLHASMVRLEVGAGGRKNVGRWIRDNYGIEPSPELEDRIWEEATQPGGPPIRFTNLAHIKHTVETAKDLTSYLAVRPWSLVRFNRRCLITSDAPVTLIPQLDDHPGEGVGFATAWGVTFPLTRKLGLLMSDPMVMLEGLESDDRRIQRMRSWVLQGRIDRIEAGTTVMERLFNGHTAHAARAYVYHHPEDAGFVPDDLPEPNLINMRAQGDLMDQEFDGEQWFKSDEREDEDVGSAESGAASNLEA